VPLTSSSVAAWRGVGVAVLDQSSAPAGECSTVRATLTV
jgi:hypothetical protein